MNNQPKTTSQLLTCLSKLYATPQELNNAISDIWLQDNERKMSKVDAMWVLYNQSLQKPQ